ncbi:MAG: protein kinase [Deltaproteobacteria bacterium]|nr:protein kinase [Deltaproteobacteria bacterium]
MPEEFGPYLVYEQLGLGGMASVHRAETRGIAGFSRPVALKRMLPHVAGNEELVRSFVREARLASHLRHANVAQTLDLGKVGDTYFIAMELVPGKNLREVLSQCLRVCGPMPLPIAINIISQIADALDYAHNLADETGTPLGIIHRDVSPSNVIVSEGGVAKLIDFGIAKASAASMQTMSRTIKGKFGYMAPEYIEGRIDARADLFALGVIAHEMLANKPLFQGTDEMDTLYRVRTMTILPPSEWRAQIPAEIDSIVMTALERDPSVRWQGAHAMRTALTTEAQRLGLVAHGAQVDEWMTWAFQQKGAPKGGEFRVETMPEISISSGNTTEHTAEETADHTAETAAPVAIATRPSSPHPRVVHRSSSPNNARAVPTDEFGEDQRTIARPDPPHRRSSQQSAVQPPRASTVSETPRGRRARAEDALDTQKTPAIDLTEETPLLDRERLSTELPHFEDDDSTTSDRGADQTLNDAPNATLVDGPRGLARRGPSTQRPTNELAAAGPPTQRPTNELAAAGPPTQRDDGPAGPASQRPTNMLAAASPPTTPGVGPVAIPPSGSRTARRLAVNAPIGDVLADLDERSSVDAARVAAVNSGASAAMTNIAFEPPGPRRRGWLLAILLLLAAVGAAAVVYFALPYFT